MNGAVTLRVVTKPVTAWLTGLEFAFTVTDGFSSCVLRAGQRNCCRSVLAGTTHGVRFSNSQTTV